MRLEERDRAPPVGDLPPRVDVLPQFALAFAPATMVVEQDRKARFGERFRVGSEAVVPRAGKTVRHGYGRVRPRTFGQVEPCREGDPAFRGNGDVGAAV